MKDLLWMCPISDKPFSHLLLMHCENSFNVSQGTCTHFKRVGQVSHFSAWDPQTRPSDIYLSNPEEHLKERHGNWRSQLWFVNRTFKMQDLSMTSYTDEHQTKFVHDDGLSQTIER